MLRLFLLLLLVISGSMASAQLPIYHWGKAFVAHNQSNPSVYSNGRSVAVDQAGNVYSTGLFMHTTDFDPGPGVFDLTAANWANTAIYLCKLSPKGEFLWAIQIATYVEFGNIEVRVDKNNNVYVASELRLPTDFDPGPGVFNLTPTGGWDAFVAKYDTNGSFVWAKQFGGPGDTVPRSDVLDIDNSGNIIICGNFNNTVDFDPGPAVYNLTSSAHIQAFIVKLKNNGDFIWAKQFGDAPKVYSGSHIADVKCDAQGNIYTVGDFVGDCDFDPGPGSFMMSGKGLRDGYIAKLDPNGGLIWAKRMGNTSSDPYQFSDSRGIDVDAANNVYTAGNFFGTFDFDPGPNTHSATSTNYDWFVLKLNANGDFVWADTFGGPEQDIGADVAVGPDGSVYAIGTVGSMADMDPGPNVYTLPLVDKYDVSVLAKVSANGALIYATAFERPVNAYGASLTRRMVVDNLQNIYITGYMGGQIDFDPGPATNLVDGGSTQSPFVLKLGRCLNMTSSTLNINACGSFLMNNEVFDSAGTYVRIVPNTAGCDSIITLNLTLNKRFTQQTKSICAGDSLFAGGGHQKLAGIYYDTLSTVLGCDSVVATRLQVHARPVPDLGKDQDLCANTELALSPGSFQTYLWQDGSKGSRLTVNAAGQYWVQVSNTLGCIASDTLRVVAVHPVPSGFLKRRDSICAYSTLPIVPSDAFTSYQWSTGANQKSIVVEAPGTYWLKVRDINGCSSTDSIVVYPKRCMQGFYIPNAFTPDGDGKNDSFKPLLFGATGPYHFTIYNRWGTIIFETTDVKKGWDGKIAGVLQPGDTFIWTCTYQLAGSSPVTVKGTVTLIR